MQSEAGKKSITEKIDELNQRAWDIRVYDSQEAFSLSKEAVGLARQENYKQGLARALLVYGFCFIRQSNYDGALPLLTEALSLYESLQDTIGTSATLEYLAIIKRNWGDVGSALNLLYNALSLTEQNNDKENWFTNNYQLGVTYKHLGNYEKALEYLFISREATKEVHNELYEAYSINVIGSIYFDNGNYEKALEYYQMGLIGRQKSGDKWGEAGSLDNIGFTHFKLKDYPQAIRYCMQSLSISQSIGDKSGESNALLHLAEIHKEIKEIDKAVEFTNESLAIRKSTGNKRGEAEILLFLACIRALENDQHEEAQRLLSDALRIAEEVKDLNLLSKARFQSYELYRQQGAYQLALEHFEYHSNLEKQIHKNAIEEKVTSLAISHKAEEARKEAETIKAQNKELSHLNKTIATKNRELEIESCLERVRTVAMGMNRREDMLDICKTIALQLAHLGVGNIRNVQTAIFYPQKGTYFNYEYYTRHNKPIITETSYTNHQVHREFAEKMMKGSGEFYSTLIPDVKGWLEYQRSTNVFIDKYLEEAPSLSYYWFSLGNVALGMSSYSPLDENSLALFKRFLNVFELSFKRYADIEAAEKQAREAQIEAALERVRGKALAMHNSQDIADTIGVFYKELQTFSLTPRRCGVGLLNRENREGELYTWNTTEKGESLELVGAITMEGHPVLSGVYDHWLRQEEYHPVLRGREIPEYYKIIRPQLAFPEYRLDEVQYGYFFFFNEGGVYAWTEKEMGEEELQIYRRFTSVLSLTYKRYNDLRQAEAQAKEAQVEASLERVRSKTMAMHNSQDMAATVSTLFSEVIRLGIEVYRCGIGIMRPPGIMEVWTARPDHAGKPELIIGRLDMSQHALTRGALESWERKEDHYSYDLKGKDLIEYFETINKAPEYPVEYDIHLLPAEIFHNEFHFAEGTLYFFSLHQMSDESKRILKRFTAVFSQAYRRYLDLQKAEAQAREAVIEAALERIRYRAMAMQTSNNVGEATSAMFTELDLLGIENFRCGIAIVHGEELEVWSIGKSGEGKTVKGVGRVPIRLHPLWQLFSESVKRKEEFLYYYLAGKEKEDYVRILTTSVSYILTENRVDFPDLHFQSYQFDEGAVFTFSLHQHSEADKAVMKRFTGVFSLTFRRYLDLKHAEAQAKEARIETALEKVRSRTMAMQRSGELSETAHLLFEQLKELGEPVERAFIGSLEEENEQWQIWATHHGGGRMDMVVKASINEPWVMRPAYNAFKEKKRSLVIDLHGKGLEEYFQFLVSKNAPVKREIFGTRRFENLAFFSKGFLGIITVEPVSAESLQLYERFASVFDLTYTRFMDLQKAEASAKEAVKQAAVDRIRAEIASMRTTKDLERITPLIWTELNTLGVPFIRCGVFIMNDTEQRMHTFLSTPDGRALASFHIPYDTPGNIRLIWKGWKDRIPYTDHWEKEDFREFADIMVQRGEMETSDQYLATIPVEGFYLNFLPFRQGMLYAGNNAPLNEEQLVLLQTLAEAFSAAYSRYEDFIELESAKEEVEKAFGELRQTQQQLVQSEKMASLGELTAGIAHEIQNPLNFVNNFSEVSKELLDEMKDELEKGNKEDAIQIAADVQQNLEKINHHGKRADAIVKSMLQHSRSSTGKKELADINALADEYLRLAYHGLRAKDKSFNAKFETDFDTAVPKISIIPQDIGRVILNLVNNAFYAVSEKSKQDGAAYQPTVKVTTRKTDRGVEVTVEDNGNGIPAHIREKIFQPFFTTKPTGQGTGLGLSLSYDIITKGHGGELKLVSVEKKGTKFIIELPLSNA